MRLEIHKHQSKHKSWRQFIVFAFAYFDDGYDRKACMTFCNLDVVVYIDD